MDDIQLCTVGDLIPGEDCRRVAQWEWHPKTDDHPVFLCNFHAEPFEPLPRTEKAGGAT